MSAKTLERTIEQKRAANALQCVQKLVVQIENAKPIDKTRFTELASCYRSYAEALPAYIVMGGLGQAVATEWAAARGGEGNGAKPGHLAHAQLANDLALWLKEQKIYENILEKNAAESLIEALVAGDQKKYQRAHAEALAWLVWLKKFCQAKLPKSTTSED